MKGRDKMGIKIGDEVWFKNDIEGHGVVLDIIRGVVGEPRQFVVGEIGGENSTYPWHIMAQFDHNWNRMVVWVDVNHVWK